MNGYGHFVPAIFWSILYWLSISAFLGVLSIAFAARGADDSWAGRMRLAHSRARRLIPAGACVLLIAVGSGCWYFYNAHVLNEYLNSKARRDIQAQYERDFKKYEGLPQPKIIAVDAAIDIFPERRAFPEPGTSSCKIKPLDPSRRYTWSMCGSRSPTFSSIAPFTSSRRVHATFTPSTSSINRLRPVTKST